MQIIYSYIEPFFADQSVYIMSDGTEPVMIDKVTIDALPNYLATEYMNRNCDKIILHGSNYAYTNEFAELIQDYSINNYGLKNINIEVIKE